jgi:anaerobic magnesium-protoporphyrin IX monomethyl ester cyclase
MILKVLLINPPRFHGVPVIREERCEITERNSIIPPYSLLQIASKLRIDGHEVQLIDANGSNLSWDDIKEKIKNIKYKVLIFRFTPTTFDWDTQIAFISKRFHPEAVTVGICFTLHTVPTIVLRRLLALDVYIGSDCEIVAPLLVSAISEGNDLSSVPGIAYRLGNKIKINDAVKSLLDWDSLPLPAYDLLPSLTNYVVNTRHGSPFTIMYASKGCPFSCIYCTERNTKLKKKSAANILNELEYLKVNYNIRTVSFFDETFTIDKSRTIAIAEGIKKKKLKIIWYCNTRVDLVDKALLKVMYDGGCRGISFGIESGSQVILDNAKKGITVDQAVKAIKCAKKIGLKVYCSFMFGLPGETWSSVNETIRFVKRTLPTGAQFNVAVPYPGTELHQIAVEKGWIKEDVNWFEMFQHEAVMRTDELSFEDLNEARKKAYHSLYFNWKWWVQNMWHVIKDPYDLPLALKYVSKIMKNYLIHKMAHAH